MAAGEGGWERGGTRLLHWMKVHRSVTAGVFAFAVMALFFLYLYVLTLNGEFDAEFVLDRLPEFLLGLQLTLILTVGSFSIGILIGFLTAAARVSRSRILRGIAKGYVDVFRGTPILVQIFLWLTLILALIPTYQFRTLVAAFLALTINTGAYQAEIFRGGLKAIQEGQLEAGRALGFTRWQLMRHIQLPQTLRLIIPPMTNEFILLLKSSALVSAIGVVELAFVARRVTVQFFLPLEAWTAATLLYLAMTVPLAKLVQTLERRFRIPGLGLPVVRPGTARAPPPVAVEEGQATGQTSTRRRNGFYLYLRRRMGSAPG
ncbi:MAG: amino acid ABC transporter permease [Thermoplasmata archaeon]